jgi:hypothetical protein
MTSPSAVGSTSTRVPGNLRSVGFKAQTAQARARLDEPVAVPVATLGAAQIAGDSVPPISRSSLGAVEEDPRWVRIEMLAVAVDAFLRAGMIEHARPRRSSFLGTSRTGFACKRPLVGPPSRSGRVVGASQLLADLQDAAAVQSRFDAGTLRA